MTHDFCRRHQPGAPSSPAQPAKVGNRAKLDVFAVAFLSVIPALGSPASSLAGVRGDLLLEPGVRP